MTYKDNIATWQRECWMFNINFTVCIANSYNLEIRAVRLFFNTILEVAND